MQCNAGMHFFLLHTFFQIMTTALDYVVLGQHNSHKRGIWLFFWLNVCWTFFPSTPIRDRELQTSTKNLKNNIFLAVKVFQQ